MINTDQSTKAIDEETSFWDSRALSNFMKMIFTNLNDSSQTMHMKQSSLTVKYHLLHIEQTIDIYGILYVDFCEKIMNNEHLISLHKQIINKIKIFDIMFVNIKIPLGLKID